MTRHVTLKEFAGNAPALIEQLRQTGGEMVIDHDGAPLARVIPEHTARQPRKPGSAKGLIEIADDFNAPLPDDVIEDFYR